MPALGRFCGAARHREGLLLLLLLGGLDWVVRFGVFFLVALADALSLSCCSWLVARPCRSPNVATRFSPLRQDEVLTALHWVRQAYGVGVGLLFGLVGVTGGVAAIVYILSCFALTTGYVLWACG